MTISSGWHWGDGWEQALDANGDLILGEDAEDESGHEPIKYADLQLYDAKGVPIIPIRIDHYDVIFDGCTIKPEHRALIAAAPDLLRACENLVLQWDAEALEFAREAINKARGA